MSITNRQQQGIPQYRYSSVRGGLVERQNFRHNHVTPLHLWVQSVEATCGEVWWLCYTSQQRHTSRSQSRGSEFPFLLSSQDETPVSMQAEWEPKFLLPSYPLLSKQSQRKPAKPERLNEFQRHIKCPLVIPRTRKVSNWMIKCTCSQSWTCWCMAKPQYCKVKMKKIKLKKMQPDAKTKVTKMLLIIWEKLKADFLKNALMSKCKASWRKWKRQSYQRNRRYKEKQNGKF